MADSPVTVTTEEAARLSAAWSDFFHTKLPRLTDPNGKKLFACGWFARDREIAELRSEAQEQFNIRQAVQADYVKAADSLEECRAVLTELLKRAGQILVLARVRGASGSDFYLLHAAVEDAARKALNG
jgi:hypothetical protein